MAEAGELPPAFYAAALPARTVRGADLIWRTDYTEAVFPESLRSLRDSGTLFRDWEESPDLVLSFYNLDHVLASVIEADYQQ